MTAAQVTHRATVTKYLFITTSLHVTTDSGDHRTAATMWVESFRRPGRSHDLRRPVLRPALPPSFSRGANDHLPRGGAVGVRRPIHKLIQAAFAGDPISAADAAQLVAYMKKARRLDAAGASLASVPDAGNIGEAYERLRQPMLSRLPTRAPNELRADARYVLRLLGMYLELYAQLLGFERRTQKRRQAGGRKSGEARRSAPATLVKHIESMRTRNPNLTETAAVRRYLSKTDPKTGFAKGWKRESRALRPDMADQPDGSAAPR